jgi:hypothetical protein
MSVKTALASTDWNCCWVAALQVNGVIVQYSHPASVSGKATRPNPDAGGVNARRSSGALSLAESR